MKKFWKQGNLLGCLLAASLLVGGLTGCGQVESGKTTVSSHTPETEASTEASTVEETTEPTETATLAETETAAQTTQTKAQTQTTTAATTAVASTEAASAGEMPANETKTVTDASGDFSYTGELQWIGDEAHGYLQVPASYIPFRDVEASGLVQYCRDSYNIVTLQQYTDTDVDSVANALYTTLQEDGGCEGLTAAEVPLGQYTAKQIYGYYTDTQQYLVLWAVADPADASNVYYLSMEFTADGSEMMGCSSTFTMEKPE